jgi:hypothetical protein
VSREGRREVYEQLAEHAGVDLPPIACWLLFRVDELPSATVHDLADLPVADKVLELWLHWLADRGLVALVPVDGSTPDRMIVMTEEGRATFEQLAAARCERLKLLMRGWAPERHAELDELLRRLARVLVPEIDTTPTPT